MPDAVLLEWEGVLADTAAARRDALLRAMADEGVSFAAVEYDDCCAGLDVQAAAAAALAHGGRHDPTLADLVALRATRDFVARLANGFTLAPHAASFLTAMELHAPLAIVTRAGRAETELALGLSGFADSIALIVTNDDVAEPLPSPARYRRATAHLARRRPVRESAVIAIVDTMAAIRAARAATLRTLAVGAPAHVAVEADAAVGGLHGLTASRVAALVDAHAERAR